MALGRPKKYNEVLYHKGVVLPESMWLYIQDIMKDRNTNFNELMIAFIESADKKIYEQVLNNMKEIQESISKDIEVNKELVSKLKNTNLKFDLFSDITPDNNITHFVQKQKGYVKELLGSNTTSWVVDYLYKKLEQDYLIKLIKIDKPNITKKLIEREVLIIKEEIK